MTRRILLLLILNVFVVKANCQTVFTDLNSLRKRADHYYDQLAYVKAADLYSEALKKKKYQKNYELNKKAAVLFKKLSRYSDAKQCYENIQTWGHSLTEYDSIDYFNILRAVGDPKADTIFTKAHSRVILNNLFRDSLYYNIFKIPFNTSADEYCALYLHKRMFFISEEEDTSLVRRYNALNNGGFARIYYSEKIDTGWSKPVRVSMPAENVFHVGPVTFYDSLKAILNVSMKVNKKEQVCLSLYSTEFDPINKRWNYLSPLSLNNNLYSVGHPSISKDGKQLLFVSDKKGGFGGTDIYLSYLENGMWTEPVNAGPKINTKGDEKYPFLTDDNILFFSSDGRYGMGGLDIYYTDFQFKDTVVVNMGFPLNSNLDDFGFSYNKENKLGCFSSNRQNVKDNDFYVYTENKVFFDLSVFDDFNKKALTGYSAELRDAELNISLRCKVGDAPNIIKVNLRPGHKYQLVISKDDYKSDTLIITTYGMEAYTNKLSNTLFLKRKLIYNASLKFKNEFSKENFTGAVLLINNLTENTLDTLDNTTATATIKLDGECEYIITSRNGENLRYIFVEKKSFKLSSSAPYYNLYLGEVKPSILHVRIKECDSTKHVESAFTPKVKVWDWVNRNEFNITPGPEGNFQIVVMDDRLFDLLIDDKKVILTDDEVVHGKYCIKYIHHLNPSQLKPKK